MQQSNVVAYVLYHTEGCHLCDIAKALVEQTAIDYRHIDICDNASLVDRYSMSIPVFVQGERELFWPFDAAQLQDFLGV
ncbi:glutaredoxin family protein [Shewanella livingstonensis]|uniref:Glutaredoxin family protein n=1 Tax=Shewanella livingstonensis TaxID=150120 RepID=A0A3G8LZ37_9GAMM|nr:glutaredoxin family protein [Shewanella livingstonensis]AZG73968.1 glutaredoxin family protein [Shewanella livingstonensis]